MRELALTAIVFSSVLLAGYHVEEAPVCPVPADHSAMLADAVKNQQTRLNQLEHAVEGMDARMDALADSITQLETLEEQGRRARRRLRSELDNWKSQGNSMDEITLPITEYSDGEYSESSITNKRGMEGCLLLGMTNPPTCVRTHECPLEAR